MKESSLSVLEYERQRGEGFHQDESFRVVTLGASPLGAYGIQTRGYGP